MRTALLILSGALLWVAHLDAVDSAYQKGHNAALSLEEPISGALELACVMLWVTEQNKKYEEKNPTEGVGHKTTKETRL